MSAGSEFLFNDLIWFDLSVKMHNQLLFPEVPLAFLHACWCAGVACAVQLESSDPQTLKPSNRS